MAGRYPIVRNPGVHIALAEKAVELTRNHENSNNRPEHRGADIFMYLLLTKRSFVLYQLRCGGNAAPDNKKETEK